MSGPELEVGRKLAELRDDMVVSNGEIYRDWETEFLGSIKNLESDARVNPNALNLAFDVWLLAGALWANLKSNG